MHMNDVRMIQLDQDVQFAGQELANEVPRSFGRVNNLASKLCFVFSLLINNRLFSIVRCEPGNRENASNATSVLTHLLSGPDRMIFR